MASCAETAEPVLATSNIPIQMATESFARSQATMAVECIRVLQCYEAGARRLREEFTLKLTQKLFPCDRIPIQIRVLFLLGFFIPLHNPLAGHAAEPARFESSHTSHAVRPFGGSPVSAKKPRNSGPLRRSLAERDLKSGSSCYFGANYASVSGRVFRISGFGRACGADPRHWLKSKYPNFERRSVAWSDTSANHPLVHPKTASGSSKRDASVETLPDCLNCRS
jgi:hypothetical protein